MVRYDVYMYLFTSLSLSLFSPLSSETSTDPYNELHLLPEPLFCLPSDNISMTSVLGTCTGRIFLAGKDGCLYEVVYHVSIRYKIEIFVYFLSLSLSPSV